MEPIFEDYHPQNFYGTHHNYGYAKVGDKWGFMGYSGQEWLIEPRFDEVLETDFSDIFIVKEGNKVGLVNRRIGFILEPIEAQDAGIFYAYDEKYLFKLKVKAKWGIMNDNRQWIIEPSLDELGRCSSQKDYTIFVKMVRRAL